MCIYLCPSGWASPCVWWWLWFFCHAPGKILAHLVTVMVMIVSYPSGFLPEYLNLLQWWTANGKPRRERFFMSRKGSSWIKMNLSCDNTFTNSALPALRSLVRAKAGRTLVWDRKLWLHAGALRSSLFELGASCLKLKNYDQKRKRKERTEKRDDMCQRGSKEEDWKAKGQECKSERNVSAKKCVTLETQTWKTYMTQEIHTNMHKHKKLYHDDKEADRMSQC